MIVGCVVGDEEIYEVFVDFFDLVIEVCYGGYQKMDCYMIDLNFINLIGGELDENYVLLLCVCIGWSIKNLCLFFFCICVECCMVEIFVIEVLDLLDGEFKGKYYFLVKMIDEE